MFKTCLSLTSQEKNERKNEIIQIKMQAKNYKFYVLN